MDGALIFPDPEVEARAYLLKVLGPRWPGLQVAVEVPEGFDWQSDDTTYLVVLTATGTGSRVGVVYERVLLGCEVSAPLRAEASRLAAEVRTALSAWPSGSSLVAGYSDNARPARTGESRIPQYWLSVNLLFKAHEFTS